MSDERLLLKARLAENKAYLQKMDIRSDTYIRVIREKLDPLLGKHFTDLDIDTAKVAFDDLYELWNKAKQVRELVKKQEDALE